METGSTARVVQRRLCAAAACSARSAPARRPTSATMLDPESSRSVGDRGPDAAEPRIDPIRVPHGRLRNCRCRRSRSAACRSRAPRAAPRGFSTSGTPTCTRSRAADTARRRPRDAVAGRAHDARQRADVRSPPMKCGLRDRYRRAVGRVNAALSASATTIGTAPRPFKARRCLAVRRRAIVGRKPTRLVSPGSRCR